MRIGFLFVLLVMMMELSAQHKSKYGVSVIDSLPYYLQMVEQNPDAEMVDLESIKDLHFDIRYATSNNFTKQVIYPSAKAFARREVALALSKVQEELRSLGLALKIYDAYRPYDATVRFYELIKDTTYVASPFSGSRHNRGCAVDLTLVNAKTGEEISMPTGYDDFSKKAHPNNNSFSAEIIHNRTLLIDVMKNYGFTVYPYEWWHFDFNGWEKYPIMNLTFQELTKYNDN